MPLLTADSLDGSTVPVKTTTFEFDRSFAGDPSENVTAAWLAIIPSQITFYPSFLSKCYTSNSYDEPPLLYIDMTAKLMHVARGPRVYSSSRYS
jgi:hypothetical protein